MLISRFLQYVSSDTILNSSPCETSDSTRLIWFSSNFGTLGPRLNMIGEVRELEIIIRNGIPLLTWCTPFATRHVCFLKSCWRCYIMTRLVASNVTETEFWAPGYNVVMLWTTTLSERRLIRGINSCPPGKWIQSYLLPETPIIGTVVPSSS